MAYERPKSESSLASGSGALGHGRRDYLASADMTGGEVSGEQGQYQGEDPTLPSRQPDEGEHQGEGGRPAQPR